MTLSIGKPIISFTSSNVSVASLQGNKLPLPPSLPPQTSACRQPVTLLNTNHQYSFLISPFSPFIVEIFTALVGDDVHLPFSKLQVLSTAHLFWSPFHMLVYGRAWSLCSTPIFFGINPLFQLITP
ncbi:hypothetical protein E1A91_A10G145800v1 [Gossypium mustelinum]|uniref:Uncharacterized protein n=1 Tax=Gossypium mustelinum TaxID=34275 RepID=A0A5D2XMI3_GOSMU|nr:hypothetical protein E1A91_A10G145800v1 [Gossypium mustelinum]